MGLVPGHQLSKCFNSESHEFFAFPVHRKAMLHYQFSSVQFSHSVMSDSLQIAKSESQHACLPAHHQLPEFTQTHIHRVGDAIQPSHPLSSPSPPAPNPSQHQGPFQ